MSLFQYQLWLFAPIILLITLFAALCVYVYYTSDKNFLARWVLGPTLLVLAFFSFTLLGQHLGYAYPSRLPEKFVYLGHTIVLSEDSSRKEWIDIFLISRKPWAHDSRLQRIPWSKNMEQEMNKAQQIQQQGGTASMERGTVPSKGNPGGNQSGDDYPYTTKRVLPSEIAPKSPPHADPPTNEPDIQKFKT